MTTTAAAGELGPGIKPDAIYTPGTEPEIPDWDEACPYCGRHWATGPERDAWVRTHCWSCGFDPTIRPGEPSTAAVASAGQVQQMIALAVRDAMESQAQKFAEMMTDLLGREGMAELAKSRQADLGFAPGEGKTAEELSAELARLQAENDALRAGHDQPPEPGAGAGDGGAGAGTGADPLGSPDPNKVNQDPGS